MSLSEKESEDSSSPPARRAMVPTRDQFRRAEDGGLGRALLAFAEELGRGVVRDRYWASLIAYNSLVSWCNYIDRRVYRNVKQERLPLSILWLDRGLNPAIASVLCDHGRFSVRLEQHGTP